MMEIKLNSFNTFEEKDVSIIEKETLTYNNLQSSILLRMMKMGMELEISFPDTWERFQRVMISGRSISRFHLDLSNESRVGLFEYLDTGNYETFEKSNQDIVTYSRPVDFQLIVLRIFIKNKLPLQFHPRARDYPYYQFAILPCNKGIIYFKVKRTKELVGYIKSHYPYALI